MNLLTNTVSVLHPIFYLELLTIGKAKKWIKKQGTLVRTPFSTEYELNQTN